MQNVVEAPSGFLPSPRLRLVDIGSAGGLQSKWLPHLEAIDPVLFEPNPASAAELRRSCPTSLVIEAGLSNVVGKRDLILTRNPLCVSLLEPNDALLSQYKIKPHFDVVGRSEVHCTRFDTLYYDGTVPAPDLVKIDVQGFEHEVLLGFGSLLSSCMGIELEAHIYPLYKNQKLFPDIVRLLDDFGLVLRNLVTVPHFDGDVVELDAYFTIRQSKARRLTRGARKKFDLMTRVWELTPYAFDDCSGE
jgi:FkbM family methyltransferase